MQITVESIRLSDDEKFPKIKVRVVLYDETSEFHNSAEVEVFIDNQNATLSEIKDKAIQSAIGFLKSAISSRSL